MLGQTDEKPILYSIPKERNLTFAKLQENAPVWFKEIEVLVSSKGLKPFVSFELENRTSKFIKCVEVTFYMFVSATKEWKDFAGTTGHGACAENLIPPKGVYRGDKETANGELPKELIEKLFPIERESSFFNSGFVHVLGIVNKVEFEDGTKFDIGREALKYLF